MLGILAVLTVAVGLTQVAYAVELSLPPDGTYLTYQHDGQKQIIGALATSDQGHVYCIESGEIAETNYEKELPIDDSITARRVAWLADHYVDSRDPLIHAAIGVLAHRYFDLNPSVWEQRWPSLREQQPALETLVEQMWNEAGESIPANAQTTYTYVEGLRSGTVDVKVTNTSGDVIAGVPYTVTLKGPAQFESGSSSISGVSKSQAVNHMWYATGEGKVSVSIVYDAPALQQLVSNQDYVRFAGYNSDSGDGVRFSVRKDFTPMLSTVTAEKIVDAGQPVYDDVTSGVADSDRDFWPDGMGLHATGWYFDNITVEQLDNAMSPVEDETAEEFLERLASAGFTPSAYGTAEFDAPGQTVRVQAMTGLESEEAYVTSESGGIGTWVWAFERDKQSSKVQQYVLTDVVSSFLEAAETNSNRSRVSVESTVTEHSAVVGAELSDTITVTGFPDDHGEFTGNESVGIGGDEPYVQVSVWWSGDPDNSANDDAYRPDSAEIPQEDSNHQLIGTWDYPATNGTLRVGGGVPDAHGEPVTITAQTHGWYVFVWSFTGDDRVMPAASAYNDAWERTRVWESTVADLPSLTTQVDPERVQVGEAFHDTARITGTVPEGAYVVFDAYEAVQKNSDLEAMLLSKLTGSSQISDSQYSDSYIGDSHDTNKPTDNDNTSESTDNESEPKLESEAAAIGKLVDGDRVQVDHTLRDQIVYSSQTRSPEAGLVYWKATLFSPEGDVLATHELGAEGEVVTVKPVPSESSEQYLAQTGASIGVATVCTLAVVTAGIIGIALRRRRLEGCSRHKK